ncbi:MAG: PEGA domain-containing protein [Methanomicrobiales archaeon]
MIALTRNIMKAVYWFTLIFFIGTVMLGFAGADTPANATGYLQVSSTPSGAVVYLDMVYQGITPESGGFITIPNLNPREYSLLLKKAGYLDYISTVMIISGQTVKVSANLKQETVTSQQTPESSMVTVALVIIFLLIIVGFVALTIRKRRKPKKPEKIELD